MIPGRGRGKLLTLLAAMVVIAFAATTLAQKPAPHFRARAHVVDPEDYTITDIEAEVEFGREVAARILAKFPLLKNPEKTRYVGLLGVGLAMMGKRTELTYRFNILDTELVNAFSAPGGYIFITRGALEKVEDEAELIAILAHEIAHVTNRHIVKEMKIKGSDQSVVSGLAHVIGGSTDAATTALRQMVNQSMVILFERGYKVDDEFEADRETVLLLASAGYDVNALARYLKKVDMKAEKTPSSVAATHPGSEEREGKLNEWIGENKLTNFKGKRGRERFVRSFLSGE